MRGGLVTFFTMAYIIALNPLIVGTATDKNGNLVSGAPKFTDAAQTIVDSAAVGQSIANAATMALLDTNAQNLRVTTYDTSGSATQAAEKAIADGNKLILGPLLSENIPDVSVKARAAKVPVISFSNDESAASKDVFIMGSLPSQSVVRTVDYARSRGVKTFAALIPRGA